MSWLLEGPVHRELAVLRDISKQTDRGAAIIVGAFIDRRLEKALKKQLHDDTEILARAFGHAGALSSYGARIELDIF